MTSLPEQFSAARQTQLDNSFNLIRSLSDQALDRTSRVLALQLDASRAAVEQSSNAVRQLLAARDPRDLLAIGSQSQQHLRTMFDYGRELFSIAATGMNLPLMRTYSVGSPALDTPAEAPAAAPVAAQQEPAPALAESQAGQAAAEAFERIGGDTASATAAAAESVAESATESATESAAQVSELAVVTSDIEPDAEPTTIAKATSEALDTPVAPPHPVAASVPVEVAVEIELPKVEPVDATPPPATAATTTRPVETRGTKGRRKQS
ncbi:phasin family protein [Massilia sp. SYSU DXS3249]